MRGLRPPRHVWVLLRTAWDTFVKSMRRRMDRFAAWRGRHTTLFGVNLWINGPGGGNVAPVQGGRMLAPGVVRRAILAPGASPVA